MATAGYNIDYFDYAELSNNYDEIYETLMSGGVVWMHLNYNNTSDAPDGYVGYDGYIRFMVTNWCMVPWGLCIVCPDGSELIFENGSYHNSGK